MAIVKAALADGPMQAEFSSGTSASGNPAIIGQTADGRARMELLGSEENLTQIKLILPGEADASPVTMANVVYLNHFLGVVLPDGIGQGTWAVDSLNRLEAQPNRPISKDFGPVQVKVSTDASAGGVTVNAASKQ